MRGDEGMADNEVVYIDLEGGLQRVMKNDKLYVKLLHKFKEEPSLTALFPAVEEEDYEKAQGLAHTVKGIAANLSLPELYKQSIEFEAQIKSRTIKPGGLESVKICLEETLKAVDKVIEQYE
jgi:HPt (histidine-containing phosphotransfer) domain-containing protein